MSKAILVGLAIIMMAGASEAGCLFGVCTDRDSCIADLIGDGIKRGAAKYACKLRFPTTEAEREKRREEEAAQMRMLEKQGCWSGTLSPIVCKKRGLYHPNQ